MLNKLLKTSFILVLAITLTACAGSKKKTPGDSNDGGETITTEYDVAIAGLVEDPITYLSASPTLSESKLGYSKKILFSNPQDWSDGFTIDKAAGKDGAQIRYFPSTQKTPAFTEGKMGVYSSSGKLIKDGWTTSAGSTGFGNLVDVHTVDTAEKITIVLFYTKPDGTKSYTIFPAITFS